MAQPFLCAKPGLSQARALLLPKVYVTLGIKFFVMAKLHFRPYIPNQTVLFPQRIDENIAADSMYYSAGKSVCKTSKSVC